MINGLDCPVDHFQLDRDLCHACAETTDPVHVRSVLSSSDVTDGQVSRELTRHAAYNPVKPTTAAVCPAPSGPIVLNR